MALIACVMNTIHFSDHAFILLFAVYIIAIGLLTLG